MRKISYKSVSSPLLYLLQVDLKHNSVICNCRNIFHFSLIILNVFPKLVSQRYGRGLNSRNRREEELLKNGKCWYCK